MKGVIRVWKELDLSDVEKHLIVVGELSSDCYACRQVGLDHKAAVCPNCGTPFKYLAFRRKIGFGQIKKLKDELPGTLFIDFEDFKHGSGKSEARKLLDL